MSNIVRNVIVVMPVEPDNRRPFDELIEVVKRDSANTPPIPVVAAMSTRFHGLTFYHQYRDADLPDVDWGMTFYLDGRTKHRPHRLNEVYRG